MNGKFDVIGTLDGWKKGDMPGNQMVTIVLSEYFRTSNGLIEATAQLATDKEIDYAVDRLIDQLEGARKKGKEKIRKTNGRIRW